MPYDERKTRLQYHTNSYQGNRDKILEKQQQQRANETPEHRAARLATMAAYYQAHKADVAAQGRA